MNIYKYVFCKIEPSIRWMKTITRIQVRAKGTSMIAPIGIGMQEGS